MAVGLLGGSGPSEVRSWPELKALDLHLAHALSDLGQSDADSLAASVEEVRTTLKMLLDSGPPNGIEKKEQTELLLGDLEGLSGDLEDSAKWPQTLPAMHSLVERLYEVAGLPHEHNHDH